jgi:rhamnogalacturonyl hydrolase YesR
VTDGCTRPLVLGYIRTRGVMTADELAAERVGLAAFALAEGFTLGTVYLEHPSTAPAAFEAMLDEVRRDNDVWAVILPAAHHVTDGGLRAMRRDLEHHGTVHLVVAAPPP